MKKNCEVGWGMNSPQNRKRGNITDAQKTRSKVTGQKVRWARSLKVL